MPQQTAEPLAALHSTAPTSMPSLWIDQLVVEALVIALHVVVRHVLLHGATQVLLGPAPIR